MRFARTTEVDDFSQVFRRCTSLLLKEASRLDVGQWHSKDVSGVTALQTDELQDFSMSVRLPWSSEKCREVFLPNLPWADQHFDERVGGEPLNPPPSHENWPWAHKDAQEVEGEKFSHTYPERFWPKWAGSDYDEMADSNSVAWGPRSGIRYSYGDLDDVVELLRKHPLTRQAYLPVYFPEDTGTVHGARVPCSLGYHFLIRNDQLSVTYYMRSCDFVRHFRDDVYMAAMLGRWMIEQLYPHHPRLHSGRLNVHIASLHSMVGDRYTLQKWEESWEAEA